MEQEIKSEKPIEGERKLCGCGQTKDPDKFCDGSHNNIKK